MEDWLGYTMDPERTRMNVAILSLFRTFCDRCQYFPSPCYAPGSRLYIAVCSNAAVLRMHTCLWHVSLRLNLGNASGARDSSSMLGAQ